MGTLLAAPPGLVELASAARAARPWEAGTMESRPRRPECALFSFRCEDNYRDRVGDLGGIITRVKHDSQEALRRTAVLWLVGHRTSQDVVDAATEALVAGVDTPSLPLLAGTPMRDAQVEVPDLLPKVMDELGLPIPPRETEAANIAGARELATMLLEHELGPSAAAKAIYSLLLPALPPPVRPLVGLHEDYWLVDNGLTTKSRDEIDRSVEETAERILRELQ